MMALLNPFECEVLRKAVKNRIDDYFISQLKPESRSIYPVLSKLVSGGYMAIMTPYDKLEYLEVTELKSFLKENGHKVSELKKEDLIGVIRENFTQQQASRIVTSGILYKSMDKGQMELENYAVEKIKDKECVFNELIGLLCRNGISYSNVENAFKAYYNKYDFYMDDCFSIDAAMDRIKDMEALIESINLPLFMPGSIKAQIKAVMVVEEAMGSSYDDKTLSIYRVIKNNGIYREELPDDYVEDAILDKIQGFMDETYIPAIAEHFNSLDLQR